MCIFSNWHLLSVFLGADIIAFTLQPWSALQMGVLSIFTPIPEAEFPNIKIKISTSSGLSEIGTGWNLADQLTTSRPDTLLLTVEGPKESPRSIWQKSPDGHNIIGRSKLGSRGVSSGKVHLQARSPHWLAIRRQASPRRHQKSMQFSAWALNLSNARTINLFKFTFMGQLSAGTNNPGRRLYPMVTPFDVCYRER